MLLGKYFAFLIGQVWANAAHRKHWLIINCLAFIIAYTALVMQPVVFGQMINAAQRHETDAVQQALLWAAAYFGLTITFWSINIPARVAERRLAFHIHHDFMKKMYDMVAMLPYRWHQEHHSGDVIARINRSAGAISGFAGGQYLLSQVGVRVLGSMIAMGIYSWQATIASLATSGIVLYVITRFDRVIGPLIVKQNEFGYKAQATFVDYVGNIFTVISLRLRQQTSHELSNRIKAVAGPLWKEINVTEFKWACAFLLLVISQVIIVSSYIVIKFSGNNLQLGDAAALFQCLTVVNLAFVQGLQIMEGLMRQGVDAHAVDGIVEDYARLAHVEERISVKPWRTLAVRDLFFSHKCEEGETRRLHHLSGVNLTILAGQKIAVIGRSGSGKSTLMTVLRGIHEAERVVVEIDGVQQSTGLAALADFTALVSQDSELFENTIRYNLTFGVDVDDATINTALKISTFDDVLPGLPQGLETDIRERGVNLSGGQKQRLALARGLMAARESSLLLLDEPTSSIDLATEARIFDNLFASYHDKAILVSIHRLHVLPRFDHIIVMQDGRVAEQGDFNTLLSSGGLFAQLWADHLSHKDEAA